MAYNYTPLQKTATDLITKFGQAVTFTRRSNSTYNPADGTFGSSSTSTYTAQLVMLDKPITEEGASSITGVTKSAMQEVEQEALCSSTTEPVIGDAAEVNGRNYRVTAVKRNQPASTVVFYEIRLAS